jgi:hypothetical protein
MLTFLSFMDLHSKNASSSICPTTQPNSSDTINHSLSSILTFTYSPSSLNLLPSTRPTNPRPNNARQLLTPHIPNRPNSKRNKKHHPNRKPHNQPKLNTNVLFLTRRTTPSRRLLPVRPLFYRCYTCTTIAVNTARARVRIAVGFRARTVTRAISCGRLAGL